MRAMLVLVVVLLLALPEVALADGTVWHGKKVVVRDYTSAAWDGIVAEAIATMNAALPRRAPRLVYRRMPSVACDAVRRRKGHIVICTDAGLPTAGLTKPSVRGRVFRSAIVAVHETHADFRLLAKKTACHELMHAVTGVRDNVGARPATSCVWGDLSAPGAWDVAFAKKVYRKYDRNERKRGKHR